MSKWTYADPFPPFPLSLQLVQCCKLLPDFHEPQIHTSRQIGDSSSTEATHVLFTSSRMVASSGRASGKSKITRKQIVGCTPLEYRDYLIPISRCLRVTLPASEMHMPIQTVCGDPKSCLLRGMTYPFVAGKRSEVVHAQYSAQLRQSRTDPLACAQTMVCSFLLDELLTSESGLSLFLSLWSRLRSDCSEIYHWLKNPVQTVSLFLCC